MYTCVCFSVSMKRDARAITVVNAKYLRALKNKVGTCWYASVAFTVFRRRFSGSTINTVTPAITNPNSDPAITAIEEYKNPREPSRNSRTFSCPYVWSRTNQVKVTIATDIPNSYQRKWRPYDGIFNEKSLWWIHGRINCGRQLSSGLFNCFVHAACFHSSVGVIGFEDWFSGN